MRIGFANNELDLVEISYLLNGNSFQNIGRMGRREQTGANTTTKKAFNIAYLGLFTSLFLAMLILAM